MNYIPHTPDDFKAMMETVGIGSIKELFSDIPGKFTLDRSLDLPKALSEQELNTYLARQHRIESVNLDDYDEMKG